MNEDELFNSDLVYNPQSGQYESAGGGGGYGATITSLLGSAGNFFNGYTNASANDTAAKAKNKAAKAALLDANTKAATWKTYAPWIIGGVIVLVGGGLFIRSRR